MTPRLEGRAPRHFVLTLDRVNFFAGRHIPRRRRRAIDAVVNKSPSEPINGSGLAVLGSSVLAGVGARSTAGAGEGAGAGAAGAAALTGSGGGCIGAGRPAGAAATTGFGGGGAWPTTAVSEAISVLGCSTIFSAEMVIPLLKS